MTQFHTETLPRMYARPRSHTARRVLLWIGGGIIVLAFAVFIIVRFFIDEPLRRHMEVTLNHELHGYTVRLPALYFHPLGCSVTLEGLTISQTAHPNPPVAHFPSLHASVHWAALLHARLVADFVFRQPMIHVNRAQMEHEATQKTSVKEEGWQKALESVYPLKINRFEIQSGDFSYIDDDPKRPLHLQRVNVLAENIRNVRSPESHYPSDLHADGVIFDKGQLRIDGHADFLAEPYAAVNGDVRLEDIALDYFKPILARMNVTLTSGDMSANGHVEYGPRAQNVDLKDLIIKKLQLDYLHSAETADAEKARAEKVSNAAKEVSNEPKMDIRVDHVEIDDALVGYVDHSWEPGYRLFLSHTNLTVDGLRNQAGDKPSYIYLTGQFMDSGDAMLKATFQPVSKKPDLDAAVMIEGTDLRRMNDLLQHFAGFDVQSGQFSLYSELSIKNDEIHGYVRPILKDMQVYSGAKDTGKPLGEQLYEIVVQVVQAALRNPNREVATTVNIDGKVSDPQTSTWQALLGLLRNAFIEAIPHQFEHPPPQ